MLTEPNHAGREGVRLNRFIARAGVCSRRKADALIKQGLIKVNGTCTRDFSTHVTDADTVEVNGRTISAVRHLYILVNKPRNAIVTMDDPKGRRTIMGLLNLPEEEKRGLFPVGRLDRDTSGVLLVTNDGVLAHRLMHPTFAIDKLYRVRTDDPVRPHEIDRLRQGIELEDGPASADEVAYVALPDRREVGLKIHEGRNRQIRRMFEALGHTVQTLERVRYAGLTTQGVRPGRWRRLEAFEIRRLRRRARLH